MICVFTKAGLDISNLPSLTSQPSEVIRGAQPARLSAMASAAEVGDDVAAIVVVIVIALRICIVCIVHK